MSAVVIYTPPPPVRAAVHAALSELPKAMTSPDAMAILYAITTQEDPEGARRQIIRKGNKLVPEGPAAGLWQFEQGGGCAGVLRHPASRPHALKLCAQNGIPATAAALWEALPTNDILAAASARLLLWTDPAPLPKHRTAGAEEIAWQYYLRTWRPGAYTRGTPAVQAQLRAKWAKAWEHAVYAVTNECAP